MVNIAWDDSKSPGDLIKSAEYNNQVSDQKSRAKFLDTETYTGSDCSGNNGETNRVLTLGNSELTRGLLVFVEGRTISPDNITVTHNDSGTTVEFINAIYDLDEIVVFPLSAE